MKRCFLILFLLVFLLGDLFSQTSDDNNTQHEFFHKIIPRYNNITITGSSPVLIGTTGKNLRNNLNWRLVIKDDYSVTFSGIIDEPHRHHMDKTWSGSNTIVISSKLWVIATARSQNVSVSYNGTGNVVWDEDKMKIRLSVNVSGQCTGVFLCDTYEKVGNKDIKSSDSDIFTSNGNTTLQLVFELVSEYNANDFQNQIKLILRQNNLVFDMQGSYAVDLYRRHVSFDYPCTLSTTIGGNNWLNAQYSLKN